MKFSHSKLSTILSCPMTYYLSYVQGISKKDIKPALYVGNAVHWGIEHNTENLEEFFGKIEYGRDQLLSEAMCHGYFKHKDRIFNEILTDNETKEKLELIDEYHELYITAPLNSHEFVGVIDLLLLTNKGFIIIDYKTSTYEPNWSSYLDQLYRYVFLVNSLFPEVPILKIGIINLRKTGIRQKKTENTSQFMNRLKFEYELNDESYIKYHEFLRSSLDDKLIQQYINNLSLMCDAAAAIVDSGKFFINFAAAEGQYGKSDFWDIFYHTPDAHVLYNIKDRIWNKDTGKFEEIRDCRPIDMLVVDGVKVLNKYSLFLEELAKYEFDYDTLLACVNDYEVDEELLSLYFDTYIQEQANGKD